MGSDSRSEYGEYSADAARIMRPMMLDAESCYRALTTHDARFDGRYVWLCHRRPYKTPQLLVFDPETQKVHEITAADSLPIVDPERLPKKSTPQHFVEATRPAENPSTKRSCGVPPRQLHALTCL